MVKAAREEAPASSENLLCEFELEDMCEQDPASWEHIACQKWEDSQNDQGCTRDSTTWGEFERKLAQASGPLLP